MTQLILVEFADDLVIELSDARQGHAGECEPKQMAQKGATEAAIHGVALPGLPKLAM